MNKKIESNCNHQEIVLVNHLEQVNGKDTLMFKVYCFNCNEVFLNVEESKRKIVNISKH